MEAYSFLISVYKNTRLDELQACLDSMLAQTAPAEQIVIVEDGPVAPEVGAYLEGLRAGDEALYTLVPLEQNVGLGLALAAGTEYCRNEWIARMDTDDLCVADRCEKQLRFLEAHPDCDVLGATIAEFIDTTDNIVGYRVCPEEHEAICAYLKKRCPLNHVTVFLRKSALERAGGYLDWHFNEDSYLWARMYLAGARFHNLPETLVYVRVGKEMYARRGGYAYYKSERDLFRFMRDNGIITRWQYCKAKCVRFVVQVLMTNRMRQWFFRKFARKKTDAPPAPDRPVQTEEEKQN